VVSFDRAPYYKELSVASCDLHNVSVRSVNMLISPTMVLGRYVKMKIKYTSRGDTEINELMIPLMKLHTTETDFSTVMVLLYMCVRKRMLNICKKN